MLHVLIHFACKFPRLYIWSTYLPYGVATWTAWAWPFWGLLISIFLGLLWTFVRASVATLINKCNREDGARYAQRYSPRVFE